jgi:hypothetical protein
MTGRSTRPVLTVVPVGPRTLRRLLQEIYSAGYDNGTKRLTDMINRRRPTNSPQYLRALRRLGL